MRLKSAYQFKVMTTVNIGTAVATWRYDECPIGRPAGGIGMTHMLRFPEQRESPRVPDFKDATFIVLGSHRED